MVLKIRVSLGSGPLSVALDIWGGGGGSKVNFPYRTLNKSSTFFAELPVAMIAIFVFFN